MEFRQLRYFATVARELSFTRAAAKLRVAQPAISRQIRQLEDELGVRLFDRTKSRVQLTANGQTFLTEAEDLLRQSEGAMLRARGLGVTVRLGYVWGLFHTLVPEALQEFRRLAPGVAVSLADLSATEQGRALAANELDAGFIGFAFEAESARLQTREIGQTRFVVALPHGHPLARAKTVSLCELRNELFLTISDEHFPGASRIALDACGKADFKPRVLQTPERGHTILGLVAAGCGVALVPETLAALPHSGVSFRLTQAPIPARLFLAWRPGFDSELLAKLLEAIKASHPSRSRTQSRRESRGASAVRVPPGKPRRQS